VSQPQQILAISHTNTESVYVIQESSVCRRYDVCLIKLPAYSSLHGSLENTVQYSSVIAAWLLQRLTNNDRCLQRHYPAKADHTID
jgi:hypothetical protein